MPDSLKNYTSLQVPVKSIVVTSTTHIPSLEMLGVENTLLGFPDTNLISSERPENLLIPVRLPKLEPTRASIRKG